MKRLAILFLLIISLTGCAALKQHLAYVKLCWHNDACRSEAIEKSNEVGERAEDLASLSGVPLAQKAAKPVAAYFYLLAVALAAGGKHLMKVKNEPV